MYQFGKSENNERKSTMKKIISAILSLTMILALVAAMGISVSAADLYESAKDGDVLYEVNFKGDDTYSPSVFYSAVENVMDVVVSDDGKSMTATYDAAAAKGRTFFGGTIKGLTYGADKQYTITMKMAVGTYYNDSGALASGNGGVYINMTKNTDAQFFADNGYNYTLVGYYGCPNIRHTFSYGAGNKTTSALMSSSAAYFTTNLATLDAEGFVDLTFVVDGMNVKIFINNVYIDECNAFTEGMVETAGNLGFTTYLYNEGSTITIKDAKIYKGNTIVTNPTYPDYYNAGEPVADYDAAKTGDVLFTADFSRNDVVFAPRFVSSNASKMTLTFDPNDKGYIKFKHDGTDGAVYYGATVTGLEIDSETRYTTEWKVKSGSGNSGLCFAVPTGLPFNQSLNIYGVFNVGKKFASQHGGTKITNSVLEADRIGSDGYVKIDDIGIDADGYATLRVEMYGYTATVFYQSADGQWIKYNEFDVTNTTKIDGSATYPHDTGFQMCVGFYLYNKNMSAEYKDIKIYKGLVVSDPEGKLDPVETTAPETTEPAPETTEPAPETTEPPVSGDTGDSFVVFAAIAVVSVIGVAVVAKKREN